MTRHDRITQLATRFRERDYEIEQATANLAKFVDLFYSAIEQAIDALQREGINTIHLPEKENLADGRVQLSFVERDYRFVFVPGQGIAFPALSECGLPDELVEQLSQRQAGRLVAFYHPLKEADAAKVLCSFYVFADGAWCVCGAGHSEHRTINEREIADFVLGFLDLIQSGFRKHWHEQHHLSLFEESTSRPETRFHIPHITTEKLDLENPETI